MKEQQISITNLRILLILVLLLSASMLHAQEWVVPADRAARLAPFQFNDSTVAAGSEIFRMNCLSCHGTPGQNNYQPLVPPPGDPAGEEIQANSDGSMFYKVTEGKGQMPSFRNVLQANDVWNVISYIRSFNSSYVQSVAVIQQLKDLKWSLIKILLSYDNARNSLAVRLVGREGDRWTPVPATELNLSVERRFGSLPLDEPRVTDSDGNAEFSMPSDLPGDSQGDLHLTVRIADESTFGLISKDTILAAGLPNNRPGLTEQRAMWNVVRKAPIWITIAYPLGVLLVWGFIFYVLFILKKIYDEGADEKITG